MTPCLSRRHLFFPENGETVAFQVSAHDKNILVLGSLGLDGDTGYGAPDVLVLPYQGRSDIKDAAMKAIARIKPKMVFLDHFDNAFPPISRNVGTVKGFEKINCYYWCESENASRRQNR